MLKKINKISVKIMGIFILSAIVAIVIGILSYKALSDIKSDSEYVLSEIKPISLNIMLIDRSFNKMKDYVRIMLSSFSGGEKISDVVASYKRMKSTLIQAINDLLDSSRKANLNDLSILTKKLLNLVTAYDNELVKSEEVNSEFYELRSKLEEQQQKLEKKMEEFSKNINVSSAQIIPIYIKLLYLEKNINDFAFYNDIAAKDILDEFEQFIANLKVFSSDVVVVEMLQLTEAYREIFKKFEKNKVRKTKIGEKLRDIEDKIQGGINEKGVIKEMSLVYELQLNQKLNNVIKLAVSSTYYIGAILFIGILIVLIVGFLISFNIVKAIREMETKALSISNGNFDEKIEVYSQDELGILAEAFNKMVSGIKNMMERESTTKEYLQRQVELISKIIKRASEGDLTARITQKLDGDIGVLADDFNRMVDNLNKLIVTVARLVKEVVKSVDNIDGFAKEQAEGAKVQSMKISDTSVALEELTASIQQVSDNAQIAEKEAMRATEVAVQGGLAVQKTIDGMKNIRLTVQETAKKIKGLGESSQEIGEIVEVISDIAEQTNLLALNAAIEAARAGEHGRGFAVVADEIRVLADKSGKAAKEIEMLIKRIQSETNESVMAMEQGTKGVLEGTKLADEAGVALKKIVEVVTKTSEVIKEISLAAKQQATASEEVVGSMEDISEVTNKVTRGAEAIFEATRNLSQLSQELEGSIVAFKVDEEV